MDTSTTKQAGMSTLDVPDEDALTVEIAALKGSLADLRDENRAVKSVNNAIRTELLSLRKDMINMNEVIKNLLSIYEVVCKERNPFLQDESVSVVKVCEEASEVRKEGA